jgi:CrcB protein
MPLLLVATGGALGSVGRYLLSQLIVRLAPPGAPVAIAVVNILGCLAFGIIVGIGTTPGRWVGTGDARAFLLVGVLGGFTTFSTFAFENVGLMRDGHWGLALANAIGQVVVGTAAVWIGSRLAG